MHHFNANQVRFHHLISYFSLQFYGGKPEQYQILPSEETHPICSLKKKINEFIGQGIIVVCATLPFPRVTRKVQMKSVA